VSLTAVLVEEHRVIEQVVVALEEAVAKLERGQAVRTAFFLEAAEFARTFTDGCHHRKEEAVLLPAMMAHGFPMTTGPLAVILAEHEQARGRARAMREAAEALERGDRAAQTPLLESARAYAALVRSHIAKEERALFPMAESAILAAKHAALVLELERAAAADGPARERGMAAARALESEMSN